MQKNYWLLQLFADGGGGDGGAASGAAPAGASEAAAPAASAESRLEALGVPKDKIRRRAKTAKAGQTVPAETAAQDAAVQQTASEQAQGEKTEETEAAPARMTWDEIMADPEYNKQMQQIVQDRLKESKAAQDTLGKLAPALEILAQSYGLSLDDVDGLASAIAEDDRYYEDKASELGVPVETAKRIDQLERDKARREAADQRTLEQQKIQRHLVTLQQQGEELKKTFPRFDLRTELQNPVFRRMTAPDSGLSVADAYYAVHRAEIQSAAAETTAKKVAEKMSASVQSNRHRPVEAGSSAQAPSQLTTDYSKMTRAEREALKQRIRQAAARGEKLYPGQ